MATKKGTVINADNNGWAEVMVQNDGECGSCQSGCGCSISSNRPKTATRVLNKIGAKKGDYVAIQMDSGKMLTGFAFLYLVPIAGLMIGAIWGSNISLFGEGNGTTTAAVFSALGLGLGFLISILVSRKLAENIKYSPVISRIIGIKEIQAEYAHAGALGKSSGSCPGCG